jgi:hypothetical protein
MGRPKSLKPKQCFHEPSSLAGRSRASTASGAPIRWTMPCAQNSIIAMTDSRLNRNAESWIDLADLESGPAPYLPTFPFQGEFINANHGFYASCPRKGGLIDVGIEGWLWPEDALKLYELAYFAPGDILELGCYRGLSTSILSQANRDSGMRKRILSVDLDPPSVVAAQNQLAATGLSANTEGIAGDAAERCGDLAAAGRQFAMVFVDHSHAYPHVLSVCRQLSGIVAPGGFCLFHDYKDKRNTDVNDTDYGVPQGIRDGLDANEFEFYGIFGGSALFRKRGHDRRQSH